MNSWQRVRSGSSILCGVLAALALIMINGVAAGEMADPHHGWLFNTPKIHQPETIDEILSSGDSTARVIVHFQVSALADGPSLATIPQREKVRSEIRSVRRTVIDRFGSDSIKVQREFDYLPAMAVTVDADGLRRLAEDADIVRIEPDRLLKAHTTQGIALMQAADLRNVYGGEGVAIAICDTGIDYTHSRLGGGTFPNDKVIGGYDFGDGDDDPMDSNGHGTHCAGIAAGDTPASGDYGGGVAPEARLYALKISSGASGSANMSDMIAAWQWCITHQNDDPGNPIRVISTSFGGGGYTDTCDSIVPAMAQAAANAVSAGITLLASSGNDGYCDQIAWPACISDVVSVGALYDASLGGLGFCVDASSCADHLESCASCSTGTVAWAYSTAADQVATYSNVSDCLDLFAPSHNATTTDIDEGFVDDFGGTSAACPYAAGLVALIQSATMESTASFLTPTEVKARLVDYGDDITYSPADITKPRPNLYATDIDGDGMPAGWEADYFSGIERDGSGDYDDDGLTDLEEYQADTLPDDADSDDDGYDDGDEMAAGTDPLSATSYPVAVAALQPPILVLAAVLLALIIANR
ncbi:S8 family peptidase [Desulfosarcina ovata]|uniref:Peptidase S8/S53 domain-containing protein n=1 Tax=Desulfosarcina ovata subsp. ovata TaxID=2752305 RepID=A0A5K8AKS3_9BACT|nr:S8 family serine peptidase [Desulfosarcina ovata]BBO92174.1 hypothetical protein DSCOOX_53540 [Desulfosarcina ovata subsp. ovata]